MSVRERIEGALFIARERVENVLLTARERFNRNRIVDRRPDAKIPPQEPFNCPICSSRIELRENGEYWCAGLRNREEVEYYLAREFPRNIAPRTIRSREPCGWKGKADGFREDWC